MKLFSILACLVSNTPPSPGQPNNGFLVYAGWKSGPITRKDKESSHPLAISTHDQVDPEMTRSMETKETQKVIDSVNQEQASPSADVTMDEDPLPTNENPNAEYSKQESSLAAGKDVETFQDEDAGKDEEEIIGSGGGEEKELQMSDNLDFTTTMVEDGMSYEDIIAAVEHENSKHTGLDSSKGYKGAKLDGNSKVSQGMDASSFDDENARGDATEFYENGTTGASLQPEAMQQHSRDTFSSSANHSGGGKENSSLGINTAKCCKTNDGGKTDANNVPNPNQEGGSPADDITREAGIVLENKLQEVQEWCKKLLGEITVYVQVANKTNEVYLQIQQLEHQESERLDRVEPDVKGATSQLLGFPFFGGEAAQNQNGAATL